MISPLLQLIFIIFVSTFCQIIGWRTKLPSILLLLVAGILAGPTLGLIAPDALLGPLLIPFVELAVAVILFEGGLSLKISELGKVGPIVFRLITISSLITWVLLGILSYSFLELSGQASALLGAILVVSGPTVVIPLLRLIRTRAPIEPILRWEGILIDPIGVVLAVLVAEVCESGIGLSAPWHIASGILMSLSIGGGLGWTGALILRQTIGKHLVPDQFIVPLSLTILFSFVTLSNALHEQSGLLTSIMMGMFVASSNKIWIQTVKDFIGHTQTMFIGILFVTLAARLDPAHLEHLNYNLFLFIAFAIIFVRPISVFASTIGTNLTIREKLALSSLAPRGIVSAALASSLGATLAKSGFLEAQKIMPFTFATIIGTVALYGLLSPWIFKILGVLQDANEGVLFVGGGRIALAFGKVLQNETFKVAFVDTNHANIRRINTAGIRCYKGSILSEGVQEEMNFEGIGNLLAFTPNDEANSLAAVEFRHTFGSAHVFQVASAQAVGSRIGGRIFCNNNLSLEKMEELWSKGYRPFCREVINDQNIEESIATNEGEYILAEIENEKLFITAKDNLKRSTKPNRLIIYGPPPQSQNHT